MRTAHLRNITDRVARLNSHVSDTRVMRSMFAHVMPRARWQTIVNRVTDLQIITLTNVPELIAAVQQLKAERTELRQQLLDLRQQVQASIVAEDDVKIEN